MDSGKSESGGYGKRVEEGGRFSRRRNREAWSLVTTIRKIGASSSSGDQSVTITITITGQGAGGVARTRDRRVPADFRAVSLATVPPSMMNETLSFQKAEFYIPLFSGFAPRQG
ncbi:hypothetical protein PoB_000318000 [Plakobranchus ocellatus]|uniref:Uncharacterized protein n=1 Tax=Plakobranchus ocellatus TaxID=259542 RepID=A0AAV3Y1Y2_9GAST|nr:hypothetical protein PoB_000318000 [Plakobranchus ocellatus]